MMKATKAEIAAFRREIRGFYRKNKRDFPFRNTNDPYKIFVSEVMLQQTQVSRVVPYYKAFIAKFPTFRVLARAKRGDVIRFWQGLGYNRRALNLHKAAQMVSNDFKEKLPNDRSVLETLPGIGEGTSGSLCAFVFNSPVVFIETNIRTVFIHFFFNKKKKVDDAEILPLIEKTLDTKNVREWYYALMDYGTMLKKTTKNPSRKSAHHKKQPPFKTSNRYVRGYILREISREKTVTQKKLVSHSEMSKERVEENIKALVKEGFIKKEKGRFVLA